MRLQPLHVLSLVVSGIAIVVAWLAFAHDRTYFFTTDSLGYIDEARNLLSGLGLTRTNLDFNQPYDLPAPTPLWTPLFSVLIAGLAIWGVDPAWAALAISWLCWALLPLAAAWATVPLLGRGGAAAVGLMAATSPGVVQWGSRAMSDVPALLISVLAFGLFVRGLTAPSRRLLFLAGFAVGFGVALRNANLAILAAMTGTLVLAAVLGVLKARETLRAALPFYLGAAVPLAVHWGRNLAVFGQFQPFVGGTPPRPLSITSVLASSREHLWEVLIDLTGSERLAMLAWDAKLLLLTAVPVLGLLGWGLFIRWRTGGAVDRLCLILLASICAVTPALITYSNARFGAYHEYRYPIQYAWCVVALAVAGLQTLVPRRFGAAKIAAAVLGTAFVVGSHAAFLHERVAHEQSLQDAWNRLGLFKGTQWAAQQGWPRPGIEAVLQMRLRLSRDPELRATLQQLPADAMIIATGEYGKLLTFEARRRVFTVWDFKDPAGQALIAQTAQAVTAQRPQQGIYYLLIPDYALMLKSSDLDAATAGVLPPGFTIVERKANFHLARYGAG